MSIKVYYKHWHHKVLHCIVADDVECHVQAIGAVKSDVQEGGDYKSGPFLAVIQGGKA